MRGTDILAMQVRGSCDLVAQHAQASADCWTERVIAGTSLPGFILWHCARIVDWGVNTVVRGVPELASSDEWCERLRYDLGHGAGVSDTDADLAAHSVQPEDVAAYATALGDQVDRWFAGVAGFELDRLVDIRTADTVHPLYATPAAWAEVESLDARPAWQILVRPCAGHVRAHIGELQTLLTAIRGATAAG